MPASRFLHSSISRNALAVATLVPAVAGVSFLLTFPAAAQSVCLIQVGGLIDCPAPLPGAPPTTGAADVTGSADPLTVTLADGFVSDGPVTLGTIGGADIDIVSDGISTIQSTGTGLAADSSAGLNAQVTNITTSGDGATAALLRAVDDLIFESDGTIATTGANADGINAQGESVTLDLSDVSTTGPNAQGVEVGTINGPAVVNFDVIDTSGDGSTGAIIAGTGDTGLNGNAIRTSGTDAAAFDISNDAAACVVLGAGGCDNTVTLDEVTTDGFGSLGGIVSSAGTTNVTIGALRTGGDEAVGLSLGADPSTCAVLGTGACDSAFTVNNLNTTGDRSPGAVARGAGNLTANVGVLRTAGDEAAGFDLASDPAACAILGAGGCDTSFSAGELSTTGDGSTGALIRSAGDTTGSVGVLSTQGDDAAGIDIASDPTACVIAGVGACDVTLDADSVSTSGDGAAGVLIDNVGATTADLGLISTQGDDSTGVGVTQNPVACLALGPGVCRANVAVDETETGGDNSPGIVVVTPGPADVSAGPVVTDGADSDGITVITDTGPIVIVAGPVTVTGPGSDGIVATSVCGDIDITATGDVVSAQGAAIVATTGCAARVTTLPGASVTGATAGIDVTTGTGATIVLGDALSATAGPALDVDGAPATVLVQATGTLNGRFDLTDANDLLTNAGTIDAVGDSSFGAGTDALVSSGRIRARGLVTFAGLESTANSGLIDLQDGAPDDVLTLPGTYTGSGAAALAVDAALATDRLVIGGAATGSTRVLVAGGFADGDVVVDAGAGTSANAFVLAAPSADFADFTLVFAAGANDFVLFGTPSTSAVATALLAYGAREVSYLANDAVGAHLGAGGGEAGDNPRLGRRLWMQAFGTTQERDFGFDAAPFGLARSYDLSSDQDGYGVQAGVDLFGGANSVIGVTGGYAKSDLELDGAPLRIDYEALNVGVYGRFAAGPLTLRGLVKYEWFWSDLRDSTLGFVASPEGKGWGGFVEAGYRFGSDALFFEPLASLEYANLEFDDFAGLGTAFAVDEADGLRGKAGVRVGAMLGNGPGRLEAYGKLQVVHEFDGKDSLALTNNGLAVTFDLPRPDTYGRATVGLSGEPAPYLRVFAEGTADFAGGVSGFGGRAGFALRF